MDDRTAAPLSRNGESAASLGEAMLVGAVVLAIAGYWSAMSVLIHRSFHSNGWDLGLINQVIWNSAHGRLFDYSFRSSSYAGDHWQPLLLLLVPLKWIGTGPEALLLVQAVMLAVAAIPLYVSVREIADQKAAATIAGIYLVGLAAARAVSFDFHMEAFAPVLAFTAILGLVRGRPLVWVSCGVVILTIKEDAALVTLALCWIAWFGFHERARAAVLATAATAYGFVATSVIIPHYRGDDLNPFLERYSYLGDSPLEVLASVITRPDLVVEQLARGDAIIAILVVLASSAFLPLLVPRLLPALALVTVVPLLSTASAQGSLGLHYLIVPATVAMMLAVVALRDNLDGAGVLRIGPCRLGPRTWPMAAAGFPVAMFLFASPLPPSVNTEWGRFDVDDHAAVAREFVDQVPQDAIVSAQSPFIPHLSERPALYEFPRVLDSEIVLLDEYGPIPDDAFTAGYEDCHAALPRLGFDLVKTEDGISMWRKVRPAEPVPEAPLECSGQH
ncbi:MAG: DUF2079 domain-containing protein [Dehalococcoidia bacterium]